MLEEANGNKTALLYLCSNLQGSCILTTVCGFFLDQKRYQPRNGSQNKNKNSQRQDSATLQCRLHQFDSLFGKELSQEIAVKLESVCLVTCIH